MAKGCRFRKRFDKPYGKGSYVLLKFASQDLSHIDWSLPSQLSCKTSLLLTCEILGQLVNALGANDKYLFLNRDNLAIPIQMQLSKKQNSFSEFVAAFSKCTINFEHFEKKVDPHGFCLSEIKDFENVAWEMCKKFRFSGRFDKRYGKRNQPLLNSASPHLYHIHCSLGNKFSRKMFLLVRWKLLGPLVNTFAANDKYHILNTDNLKISIQMQFSEKQKTFSLFLAAFLKSILNFKNFQKMMSLRDFVSSKLRSP